jgi:hypothetical protein
MLKLHNIPQCGFQSSVYFSVVPRSLKKIADQWCRLNLASAWNHITIENGGVTFYFSSMSDLEIFNEKFNEHIQKIK